MSEVTIRQLRHHGGEVVDRAAAGEEITITRGGKSVATLLALAPAALPAETLLARWRHLPAVDPAALRADVDAVVDPDV
jgi:prevent-host-death family protein